MANIRYVGAETSTEAFGKTFMASEWTDDADLDDYAVETLRTNPQFVVTEGKPDKAAKVEAPIEPAPVTLGGVDFDPNAPTPVEATDEPNPVS